MNLSKYLNIPVISYTEIINNSEYFKQNVSNFELFKSENINMPAYFYNIDTKLINAIHWSDKQDDINPQSFYFKDSELLSVSWESFKRDNSNLPVRIDLKPDEELICFYFSKNSNKHISLPDSIFFDFNGNIKNVSFDWRTFNRFKNGFDSFFCEFFCDKIEFFESPTEDLLDYIQLINEEK